MSAESDFDSDIAAMDLGKGEKWGLQIYRNYTKAFDEHAIKRFLEKLNEDEIDTNPLVGICELISTEDPRFLPVIVCSYVDIALKSAFKQAIPSGVPGGKDKLFTGYGPLSDLSKRIKLAYAFDIISKDLLTAIDKLRQVRNDLSHTWDIRSLSSFYTEKEIDEFYPIEDDLAAREQIKQHFSHGTSPEIRFRIRLAWIAARITYEAAAYNLAKVAGVRPDAALYAGKGERKWLGKVSAVALNATVAIMAGHNSSNEPEGA